MTSLSYYMKQYAQKDNYWSTLTITNEPGIEWPAFAFRTITIPLMDLFACSRFSELKFVSDRPTITDITPPLPVPLVWSINLLHDFSLKQYAQKDGRSTHKKPTWSRVPCVRSPDYRDLSQWIVRLPRAFRSESWGQTPPIWASLAFRRNYTATHRNIHLSVMMGKFAKF